jgi:signal transduction histidine kinase
VDGAARPLPAGIELSAYRVVQEALTNVRKHAPGVSARVLVTYGPAELELCVRNAAAGTTNGEASAPGTGHGIVGMRERVALYGGSLETHAEAGGGFVVRARLPVEVAP